MIIAFKIFLIIHIAGGSTGLFYRVNKHHSKKGTRHKQIGKVFIFNANGRILIFCTFLSSHTNYFLFMVGLLRFIWSAQDNDT